MQAQTLRRTDGTIVCERCTVADNPLRRMKGLLGRDGLESGEGLLLRPASAVHTYFMRFPIDVVFLDAALVVVGISDDVDPWRATSRRGAKAVLELPAGESARRGLAVGDRLELAA
ncbi:MAG TPA: DUF192 domain-containing protein [Gaiellaceae bacterium]|nr:DUF192 domain-containing protein [Gaiellaceae bacterium]